MHDSIPTLALVVNFQHCRLSALYIVWLDIYTRVERKDSKSGGPESFGILDSLRALLKAIFRQIYW